MKYRTKIIRIISLLLVLGSLQLHAAKELFPRPAELLPNIAFWTNVYGVWTTEQIAFADSEDLSLVYRVISVPQVGERFQGKTRDQWIKEARAELVDVLNELEKIRPASEKEVTGLALEVYLAIRTNKRADKYRRIDYIRAQNGLRNRFEHGYMLSGAHEMEIKARLRQFGLPEELIAIVFVESLFYSSSKSSAGAAGIWQFMRHTAKEFLHVNSLVDERYDPIIATEAAIQYVITAKQKLGEWPLVITSYNHGRAGMLRAVNQVNSSDLVEIIKNYNRTSFGFASRNYYAEFLAALDVYQKAADFFPGVIPVKHWNYSVVEVPNAVLVKDLLQTAKVEKEWLFKYNPALTSDVKLGKEVVPAAFKLRIPSGQADLFYKQFKNLPENHFVKAHDLVRARHKANGRQRVVDIANQYDIFQHQLAKRLGWDLNRRPKKGEVILLRSVDSRFTELPQPLYILAPENETNDESDSLALAESVKDKH